MKLKKMKVNILIPMSGLGTRFKDSLYIEPKPFIKVIDDTMIRSVIKNLNFPEARFIFVINLNQISVSSFSEHISDLISDFEVLSVSDVTEGPAITCLLAKKLIEKDPLIIVNCDQIIHDFNIESLLSFCSTNQCDGIVGCFLSSSNKNSYIKLDENMRISLVREKEVISNIATNGFHFWANGSDFVTSSLEMIGNSETYNGEFYVAPSYNYLIKKGKKILPFFYNLHFPIGTPEDLDSYKIKMLHGDI
jgi:dTDP-glucose pyrophosphorylase